MKLFISEKILQEMVYFCEIISSYWPLRDISRSSSTIQFPPPPPPTPNPMFPIMRGLVIVGTRSGLVFEQLVCTFYLISLIVKLIRVYMSSR